VSHSSTLYSHANNDATVIAPPTRGDDNSCINNSNNNKNRTKKTSSSKNIVKTEMDFLICNRCFWCASLYTKMKNISNIKCSICKDNRNLESIPISETESFKIDNSSQTGIVLEFSR
jgi:hypothetical protein